MTQQPPTLRDRLLAGPDRPLAPFRLPESDETVYLRRLTYGEVTRLRETLAKKDDPDRLVRVAAVLIGDERNRRLFADDEAGHLAAALTLEQVRAVTEAGVRLLLPGKEGVEQGKENSPGTPPSSSSAASPSPGGNPSTG